MIWIVLGVLVAAVVVGLYAISTRLNDTLDDNERHLGRGKWR